MATPVALLVVVALVIATLVVIRHGGSATPRAEGVDQATPGPVLLVPGYGGSTSELQPLARALTTAGRDATIVRLPGDGTGDLTVQARTLGEAVRAALARTGAATVDLVGYSAGGVVVRLWVADDGGAALTRRVVTLGSPHHGTQIATLAASLVGSLCPTACQQLATGSPLLNRLNRGDETPAGPSWLALWTTDDQVVVPPDSASLAGADDVALQSLCPDRTVGHTQLPGDAVVTALVTDALAAGPLQTPTNCPV